MKPTKATSFIFYHFIIIYFIYVALNNMLFPKHSYPTYIVNGFFLLFTIYVTFKYVEIKNFMIPMYLFFIYLLILICFSSDFFYSSKTYIKTLIPALFLPISFSFIRDIWQLKKFNKVLIILATLYIINLVVANKFELGMAPYASRNSDYALYIGNVFTEGLNSISYILVTLPLILYLDRKHKRIVIILGALVFITLLLNLKRISIIAIFMGYFFLVLFSKRKSYYLKSIVTIILLLLILYPFYKESLQYQFMNRSDRFTKDFYENEGRYIETKLVWDEVFGFNSITQSLFGKEMFNSPGNYGAGIMGERMLHMDYNVLLEGAGIFGLLFYFYFNIIILKYFLKLKKNLSSKDNLVNMMNATFMAMFFMSFIISFSGSFGVVVSNSIRSIYLGAILGIYNNIKDSKYIKKHTLSNKSFGNSYNGLGDSNQK